MQLQQKVLRRLRYEKQLLWLLESLKSSSFGHLGGVRVMTQRLFGAQLEVMKEGLTSLPG